MPTLTTRLPFSRASSTDEPTATIHHRVLPLQSTTVPGMPTENDGMDMALESSGATSSASSIPIISEGAQAGMSISMTLCLLGVVGGCIVLYWCKLRKWRTSDDDGGDSRPSPPGDDPSSDKPELEGSSTAQARGAIPKAELDVGTSRAELGSSEPESRHGTVSLLNGLSSDPAGSDPRHKNAFEVSG
ncbi:hypothetical protein F5Y00DRAFT_269099 [Daldinia vernicosa]|uniref:uncharacterized protein n=1 Tax=Daldinia vernicosa TaxID=114800 RepID=UPI002007BC18|nr:uncharacterized protein F5Y00DRAFT_269099 [Daldinia vernicosa]KAI0853676.1 hypothetical protein F5Y00DRAFT_269099 [Daldinia vernicosa]